MPEVLADKLSVQLVTGGDDARARDFASRHGCEIVQDGDAAALVLRFDADGVSLVQSGKDAPGPVSASFVDGAVEHRRKFGGGKGQMIAKAVGLKSGIYPRVLDATAGLGKDAFVLATLGCDVALIERSPVVAELLFSALRQAAAHPDIAPIVAKLHFIQTDSQTYMADLATETAEGKEPFDVVYLDPMFPHRDKSALVKKEMRVFREIVGDDIDADGLLPLALKLAHCRVVVKRPRKAPVLAGMKPSLVIEGKSSRYDIYTKRSLEVLRRPEAPL